MSSYRNVARCLERVLPPTGPRQNKKKPDARKAVAYLRRATTEQHVGPEAQQVAIEEWAVREGVTVISWHVDHGVSGLTDMDQRPALVAALAKIHAEGVGILVVAQRDRLARDVHIAAGIERHVTRLGARVVSADGVGSADLFMRALGRGDRGASALSCGVLSSDRHGPD